MPRRCLLRQSPPPEAENYRGLRILLIDAKENCHCFVKVWAPRGLKPYAFHSFPDAIARHRWVEAEKRLHDNRIAARQERQAERSARALAMAGCIQVGTLLAYSWGYDQTNVDCFQVVRKNGRCVWIRPIATEPVAGTEQGMADHRRARRDHFTGRELRKIIGPYGISMKHGTASITTETESHYCSWYA